MVKSWLCKLVPLPTELKCKKIFVYIKLLLKNLIDEMLLCCHNEISLLSLFTAYRYGLPKQYLNNKNKIKRFSLSWNITLFLSFVVYSSIIYERKILRKYLMISLN